jgi:hypothetical protein
VRVFGIDFTSSPSARKPLVCACGRLRGRRLAIDELLRWTDYEPWERLLQRTALATMGVDFPLGLPREALLHWGWPLGWQEYVECVARLTKAEFVKQVDAFRATRPPGAKHPLRQTDAAARGLSPLMVHGVPVGRMFYEGATRVARAGSRVLPQRPRGGATLVLEVYPALAARRLLGGASYKSEAQGDAGRTEFRSLVLRSLASANGVATYGLRLELSAGVRQAALEDPRGDALDAVLACLQAAWAVATPGIVERLEARDVCEGWIADPDVLEV